MKSGRTYDFGRVTSRVDLLLSVQITLLVPHSARKRRGSSTFHVEGTRKGLLLSARMLAGCTVTLLSKPAVAPQLTE